MSEYVPLYLYSLQNAEEMDEVKQWRESHRENCKCANDITEAIHDNYHNDRLEDCVQPLIEKYGFDRVNWVIANTICEGIHDGRYSPENKKWARSFDVMKDDHNWLFCATSHPGLVNLFADQLRAAWNELGLFDRAAVTDEINYEDKLLILKPTVLKYEYRKPDFQLFFATDGFGCDPKKVGAKVFGFFLKDDEHTSFRRNDFYGVANDAALPEWALERLNEIREKLDIDETDSMTPEVSQS